jgi:hypothetical protein
VLKQYTGTDKPIGTPGFEDCEKAVRWAAKEQAMANVEAARFNLEQARAELRDAALSFNRNKELLNRGVIAQAVNTVTASGALYFSAAGNDGNLRDGTSGTWEGDFVDGGQALPAAPGQFLLLQG